MLPIKIAVPPKQQSLVFAQDEAWKQLPQEMREAVRDQLVLMLLAAKLHDRETKRSENER